MKSDLLLRRVNSRHWRCRIVMVMAAMMIKPQAPRRFLLAERSSPTKVEPQNISGSVMRKAEKPVQQVMWNCLNHLISLGRRQPGLEKEISWRSLPAARLLLREVRGLEWAVRPLSIPAWCSIVEKKTPPCPDTPPVVCQPSLKVRFRTKSRTGTLTVGTIRVPTPIALPDPPRPVNRLPGRRFNGIRTQPLLLAVTVGVDFGEGNALLRRANYPRLRRRCPWA